MEPLLKTQIKRGIKKIDSKLSGIEELVNSYIETTEITKVIKPILEKTDQAYTKLSDTLKLFWNSYFGEYFDAKIKAFRSKYERETTEKIHKKGFPKTMSKIIANLIPSTEDKQTQDTLAYTLGGFLIGGLPKRFISLTAELTGVSEKEINDGEFYWRHFNNVKDSVELSVTMMGGKLLSMFGADETLNFKPETIAEVALGYLAIKTLHAEARKYLWEKKNKYIPNHTRLISPTGFYSALAIFGTDWVMTADENNALFHKIKTTYDKSKEYLKIKTDAAKKELLTAFNEYNNTMKGL